MSLDDKLKNYAKYQLDYERSNRVRKALFWESFIYWAYEAVLYLKRIAKLVLRLGLNKRYL